MENCNSCDSKTIEIRRLHTVCKSIRSNALQNIYLFTQNADLEIFKKIFGTVAPHLWEKFSKKHKYDLISFYASLDDQHQNELNNYFNDSVL